MIVDCFAFFNELDVLEIRLRELADTVDVFVLVEGTKTFSGKDKPLYFRDNMQRYSEFLPKIYRLAITDYGGIDTTDAWAMDWAQKEAGLAAALQDLRMGDDDVLLLSDCDEIPRASAVRQFVAEGACDLAVPLMPIFYFWLNWQQIGPFERCAKWIRRGRLRAMGDRLRAVRELREGAAIPEGGWHFSYTTDFATKIGAWAHRELDRPEIRDLVHLARCRAEGLDPFGRSFRYRFLSDLGYLPAGAADRFPHLIRLLPP